MCLARQCFARRNMVGIVQLVRAPDCGSGCRGFESHYPPHKKSINILFILFFMGFSQLSMKRVSQKRNESFQTKMVLYT